MNALIRAWDTRRQQRSISSKYHGENNPLYFPPYFSSILVLTLGEALRDYLEERARRGSRKKFERALRKVADVAPEERDRT